MTLEPLLYIGRVHPGLTGLAHQRDICDRPNHHDLLPPGLGFSI